jgi:hypothetical protein
MAGLARPLQCDELNQSMPKVEATLEAAQRGDPVWQSRFSAARQRVLRVLADVDKYVTETEFIPPDDHEL